MCARTHVCMYVLITGCTLYLWHCLAQYYYIRPPSKHVGSDPEVFDYGQSWPLWPVCSQNWGGLYIPDLTSRIRFSSVFFREGMDHHICTNPTRIQSGRPCQGLVKHIWSGSKPVCRHHRAQFLAGCNWSATSFPLSDSVAIIHRCPDHTVQNQPRSNLVLTVRFWPNGSCLEASWCARIIRPTSGQSFELIRIGSGMFTGLLNKSAHYLFADNSRNIT